MSRAKAAKATRNRELAARMGRTGREHVIAHWSVERMVAGYQALLGDAYAAKCDRRRERHRATAGTQPPVASGR